MSRTMSPIRAAALYYGLSLAMVTAAAAAGAGTAVAATAPLLATLLMLVVVTREGRHRSGWAGLGLHTFALRTWPVALLTPIAVITTGGTVAVATGAAHWSPTGQIGDFGPWTWPGIFAINVLAISLTTVLTEEIGWRGYFLPRLTVLGERRALLLSGLLHGVWHLPVALLTGLYLADGNRWIVLPVFVVSATAFGVFVGWLRLRTGSVWPAVLGHASHNVAIMWLADALDGDSAAMEHLAGESGLVTVVAYLALAAVLLARASRATTRGPAVGAVTVGAR
jgi:membrane protease YdiL (CAAX protease family)